MNLGMIRKQLNQINLYKLPLNECIIYAWSIISIRLIESKDKKDIK